MKTFIHCIFEMAETILRLRSAIFRLILSSFHLVYSGLEYFDTAWALFKRKLISIFQHGDSQLYVSQFVTSLKKCPSHFAVITGDERINLEDYSNLVIWCVAAGISFISFYDYTGYMKDNEELYFNYLINKKKLDANNIVFNENKNGVTNGICKNGLSKKIHVNILCQYDGKQLFNKLLDNLCRRAVNGKLKPKEIDEKYLDNEIYKMVGFLEPELAVITGSVCSTFGFSPWHLRLTEFLQVPSLKNVKVTDFTSMLWRYSSCQQRFGT